MTISRADRDRFSRYESQVKGIEPFANLLQEIGVKNADELRALVNPSLEARRAGINLSDVLSSVARGQASSTAAAPPTGGTTPAAGRPLTQADLDRQLAARDHARTMDDQTAFVNQTVNELAGTNATPEMREVLKHLTDGLAIEAMTDYPIGHPLRGREIAPIADRGAFQAKVKALWQTVQGAFLSNLGAAASSAPAPTGAGTQPQMGAATAAAPGSIKRDAMYAKAQRLIAAGSGAPISTA